MFKTPFKDAAVKKSGPKPSSSGCVYLGGENKSFPQVIGESIQGEPAPGLDYVKKISG